MYDHCKKCGIVNENYHLLISLQTSTNVTWLSASTIVARCVRTQRDRSSVHVKRDSFFRKTMKAVQVIMIDLLLHNKSNYSRILIGSYDLLFKVSANPPGPSARGSF